MSKKQTNGNLALEQQRVIVIPAHDEIVAHKLRVAAYARVSSSSEDQLNSYRVQNQYYSELISGNPDWEMVDIYADEGITGTSVEKREDFRRMMRDCRKGKIDRILVKSISRFARNTKDCLAAVRELKELGISVLFEEQGIDTARVSSEMVTAIMASLAQKGSESISGNTRMGIQWRMESGHFRISNPPLGYNLEKGVLSTTKDGISVVKFIFDSYLAGQNSREISEKLNSQQALNRTWSSKTVDYVLQNERYYTDKIMSNKEWTMAGIFADEGITGTSTKKRTEFLRMIRQCKQKKIDLILTKSIQRFARNTLDCINYTRILRQLGIGVLFEKENINSLPPDSEFMITMYGAMAQSESESISGNIRRGRQMHAKVGTLKVPCYRLYGYEKDTEGKFCVIPEQAEIVRELYKRYESGASLRNLQDWLEENQIKTVLGESKWTTTSIKSILTNEKYCGDVLLQKTFRTDVISKKVIKNVGQMAQYYMPDHHEGIVSREQYNAVKAEMARRSALRSPSKSAVTGRSCYTSKYALSDRLVCGECGTLYRRCTWTSLGRKYPVWRCTSRLNYGTKYCHDSPTIKEEALQNAILAAINSAMRNKPVLLDLIKNAVSLVLLPIQGQTMSLADIDRQLARLDEQFQCLLAEAIDAEDKEACNAQFAEILAEQTALKKQKEEILQGSAAADRICTRMKQAGEAIENTASTITEWNENAVRQIVERVTVLSADEVLVQIKGGAEIKQRLE